MLAPEIRASQAGYMQCIAEIKWSDKFKKLTSIPDTLFGGEVRDFFDDFDEYMKKDHMYKVDNLSQNLEDICGAFIEKFQDSRGDASPVFFWHFLSRTVHYFDNILKKSVGKKMPFFMKAAIITWTCLAETPHDRLEELALAEVRLLQPIGRNHREYFFGTPLHNLLQVAAGTENRALARMMSQLVGWGLSPEEQYAQVADKAVNMFCILTLVSRMVPDVHFSWRHFLQGARNILQKVPDHLLCRLAEKRNILPEFPSDEKLISFVATFLDVQQLDILFCNHAGDPQALWQDRIVDIARFCNPTVEQWLELVQCKLPHSSPQFVGQCFRIAMNKFYNCRRMDFSEMFVRTLGPSDIVEEALRSLDALQEAEVKAEAKAAKAKAKEDAKRSLQLVCSKIQNISGEESIKAEIGVDGEYKIEKAVLETSEWLDRNDSAEQVEFETKQKELEGIFNSVRMRACQVAEADRLVQQLQIATMEAVYKMTPNLEQPVTSFAQNHLQHEQLFQNFGHKLPFVLGHCLHELQTVRTEIKELQALQTAHPDIEKAANHMRTSKDGASRLQSEKERFSKAVEEESLKFRAEIEELRSAISHRDNHEMVDSMNTLRAEFKERVSELQFQVEDLNEGIEQKMNRLDLEVSKGQEQLCGNVQQLTDRLSQLEINLGNLDNKSAFFTIYKTVPVPKTKEDVWDALASMMNVYSDEKNCSKEHIEQFLCALRETASPATKPASMSDVQWIGARLWTSADKLEGTDTSLCNILSEMNYSDNIRMLTCGGMTVQKSLNKVLVSRGSVKIFPPDGKSHRGTGIPRCELGFWTEGKKYRAAAILASSFDQDVATGFLQDVDYGPESDLEPVHFIFEWQKDQFGPYACDHAFYVDKISAVKGEREIVLAGYSVLEVASVVLKDSPTISSPHIITCKPMQNNRTYPEYLPIAKWH